MVNRKAFWDHAPHFRLGGTWFIAISLILTALPIAASSGAEPADAVQKFTNLQIKLREARKNQDWPSSLRAAKEIEKLLNEAPDSLLEVARAEVHVHALEAAVGELNHFVEMGQSTELLETSPEFAGLRATADYQEILGRMKKNRTPVSLGVSAFSLRDPALLAEDMDYAAKSGQFFITSVRGKKIIAVHGAGVISDFAKTPDHWPALALKIDPARGLLWATEVAMQGFRSVVAADWGRSALLCYDLKTGKLLRRVEGPRGSALGDMALTVSGDVIVSDGGGGGVYRLSAHGSGLERLDQGDFISPQTPAIHPGGKRIFVPDYARGIGVLEIATRRVQWISMQNRFALNGIDGLYFDRGRLIAVQNGTSPQRVVAFTLDDTLTTIKSETILEQATATLGVPTHGLVKGDEFYYIANSGWDAVDDQGEPKPEVQPSPPLVRYVRIHGR